MRNLYVVDPPGTGAGKAGTLRIYAVPSLKADNMYFRFCFEISTA